MSLFFFWSLVFQYFCLLLQYFASKNQLQKEAQSRGLRGGAVYITIAIILDVEYGSLYFHMEA